MSLLSLKDEELGEAREAGTKVARQLGYLPGCNWIPSILSIPMSHLLLVRHCASKRQNRKADENRDCYKNEKKIKEGETVLKLKI